MGGASTEPPANAEKSPQSTIQTTSQNYASIVTGANRLPDESGIEECPIGSAANIIRDTKLEDQTNDPIRNSEIMLVNSTSAQTEQNGIHHDTPKQPLHQGVVDVTSGKKTKVIGNLGPQDTCPEANNTGGNPDKVANNTGGNPDKVANNTGGNADKAAKYQDERFSGAPPFKTNREAADHYYNMYKELELKNTRLTNLRAELKTKISNLSTSNTNLHDENGKLWDRKKKQFIGCNEEADQLKEQLDDLYRSHIHSINSVNTGLDPISDQTSKKSLVPYMRRKAFKHLPNAKIRSANELAPDLQAALDKRRYLTPPSVPLRFGHFIETVTWIVLEDWVLSCWFPGLKERDQEFCVSLHDGVSEGDTSSTLERAEYWRAYTASLLFQNTKVQKILQDVQKESDDLLHILSNVQTTPSDLLPEYISDFQRILRNLRTLGAQLRCQRAVYEIDHSVTPGQPYDETRMDGVQVAELENVDHRKERAYVTCVLSNGIVKKKLEGLEKVETRICKARVLVTVAPNDKMR
ncbi:hypothetical protein BDD12DRAFT_884744 [Trichophaea hybrida]|nr:hypothetical protein BDD12DRAFT_884744 [Trichophaea hybrida]